MAYVSDNELFHFVGRGLPDDQSRFGLLLQILDACILSHPPHDGSAGHFGYVSQFDGGVWQGDLVSEKFKKTGSLLFPNIICFADIPFDQLSLHTSKYSEFGLSFTKSFVARYGGRPVMYFPIWEGDPGNLLFGDKALDRLNEMVKQFEESALRSRQGTKGPDPLPEDVVRNIYMEFLAFIKPFNVQLPNEHPDQFYLEREWRKIANLRFTNEDLKSVIVPADFAEALSSERPDLDGKIRVLPGS